MDGSLTFFILPLAVLLDLLLGDPRMLPHPIRWMGLLITRFEPVLRQRFSNPFRGGLVLTVTLVMLVYAVSLAVVLSARNLHPGLGDVLEIILIYYSISIRSLHESAMAVHRALARGALKEAKNRIKYIVGRDVTHLDQAGVSRAAVETVAENLVDGIVSPIFYAMIGGAPLAMGFKMISTLDSMIGYKNESYREFGKFAARLDDAANYIPARLSVIIISVCSMFLYQRGRDSMGTALKEGKNHSSPNAGRPEAAFAGALGVKLGGPGYYQDRLVDKPYIGQGYGEAKMHHIRAACRLMFFSAILWAGTSTLLIWIYHTWLKN